MLSLLAPWPVAAQEQRGQIEGIVRDTSGAVLPGVTVEARSANRGVTTTVTDASGQYRFPSLAPGNYEVVATLEGFTPARSNTIDLRLGQILRTDLTLQVGGVTENVVVTGETPLIDVKQSASFANIEAAFIDRIPTGRDFTSVVTVAPGANQEDNAGGISIDGASGAENKFIIDGVDTTDLQTGESGKTLVVDFVEEIQVKSSGFAAEFGGATGGVINVITRSGTNNWRGTVGTYFESDALEAPRRQTLRLNPIDDRVAEYVQYPEDSWTQWEPAMTLGGPLVRDRLWFFAGYVPRLTTTERSVTFLANDETGTFESKERRHNFVGNVSSQVNQNIRAKFSATLDPYRERGQLPVLDGSGNPTFDYPGLGENQPSATYQGQIDFIVTPKLFLAARTGHFRSDLEDLGVPNQVWSQFSGSNFQFPEIPANLQRASGSVIPTNDATTQDLMTRTSVNADATYYANLGGQHTIRGGVQFDRIGNDVIAGYQQPRNIIYWDRSYTTAEGQVVRGQYGYHRVLQIVTQGEVTSNNVGLFLQDAWTVNNRLTLNLGVRTERERVPSYAAGLPGLEFDFGEKIAPRLGFAWDITGDSKWKAYGSWGMFYDTFKLELPRGSFGGDKWIDYFYTLDSFDWPNFVPEGGCTTNCGGGTFIEQLDRRHPSNDPDSPTIEPDLKPMRSQEFTLGLDHELTQSLSVGVRYVHKQLDQAIEDVGVLVPGLGEVFYIANPGRGIAQNILGPGYPALPEAVRDYDSVEFRVKKRFSQNWGLDTSYRWSKLYGNYSGLASSDEVTVTAEQGASGRTSPNVNRFFDALIMSFDQEGREVLGRLGTDRPHQFKANGFYSFPFGTTVGLGYYLASGTPVTREASVQFVPVQYLGRLSDGRTPRLSSTDLVLQHEIRFGDRRIELSMNVLNLFDQDTATSLFNTQTRDDVAIGLDEYFAGQVNVQDRINQQVAEEGLRLDPRFLMANSFQPPRAIRFGAKFRF
ncbi:MAG TPA: TonB-dependent receptor [Vicinamibacterales bacterium]|nr:TonB-dependent receptor [Vicinamibacterales bacterium]